MQHTYGVNETDGKPVRFHGQLICDLATVVEIGEHVVTERRALNKKR